MINIYRIASIRTCTEMWVFLGIAVLARAIASKSGSYDCETLQNASNGNDMCKSLMEQFQDLQLKDHPPGDLNWTALSYVNQNNKDERDKMKLIYPDSSISKGSKEQTVMENMNPEKQGSVPIPSLLDWITSEKTSPIEGLQDFLGENKFPEMPTGDEKRITLLRSTVQRPFHIPFNSWGDEIPEFKVPEDNITKSHKKPNLLNEWSEKRIPFGSWTGQEVPLNSWGKKVPFDNWREKSVPFHSWGGKRVPFDSWGGKRVELNSLEGKTVPFHSWGGKRTPFNSWGGKRTPFNSWGGKRTPFNSWGGKRTPFNSWGGKRTPFNSWGGKRTPFNSWGGKRTPFNSWGGKRAPFNSWGGKRTPFNSWGGKRTPFNSWGGKRTPFNSWGGKRTPFNSWGGKRTPFNSWGGKRTPFNSWGGKRDPCQNCGEQKVPFHSWGGKRSIFKDRNDEGSWYKADLDKSVIDDLAATQLLDELNEKMDNSTRFYDINEVDTSGDDFELTERNDGQSASLRSSKENWDGKMYMSPLALQDIYTIDDVLETINPDSFTNLPDQRSTKRNSPATPFNPWGGKRSNRKIGPWNADASLTPESFGERKIFFPWRGSFPLNN